MAGDDRQHHSFGPCEAIICDENGLAVFELIRRQGAPASAVHCAFDLLELDGKDLRREPIEKRKALLAKLLRAGLSYWKRTHNSKAAGDTKTDGFACSLAPLPHWFAPTRTGKAIGQRAGEALSFVDRR